MRCDFIFREEAARSISNLTWVTTRLWQNLLYSELGPSGRQAQNLNVGRFLKWSRLQVIRFDAIDVRLRTTMNLHRHISITFLASSSTKHQIQSGIVAGLWRNAVQSLGTSSRHRSLYFSDLAINMLQHRARSPSMRDVQIHWLAHNLRQCLRCGRGGTLYLRFITMV